MTKIRCEWCLGNDLYINYHDTEWGVPIHDDNLLFEFICLEGAQAGLSWITILKKRENYKKYFYNFNIKKVANLPDSYLNKILLDPGIIRNKNKIYSVRSNAQCCLEIIKEFGSLDNYFWDFVNHKPIKNKFKTLSDIPASTPLSDKLAKDLKKRGFKFVGSTICYAFMQAVGMVNDHVINCYRY